MKYTPKGGSAFTGPYVIPSYAGVGAYPPAPSQGELILDSASGKLNFYAGASWHEINSL